ncbi:unnamed protein product [Peniophora sp. CBMAI 1063]|nr:unnamed protein product [Peniophora sp. CBMAI 1063]
MSPQVPRMDSAIAYTSPILYEMLHGSEFSNCQTIVLRDGEDLVTYLCHVLDLAGDGRLPVLAELNVGASHSTGQRLVRFCRNSTGPQATIANLPKLKSLTLENLFFPVISESLETIRLRRVHCSATSAVPRLRTVVRTLVRPHAHTLHHLELSRAFKLDDVEEASIPVALPVLRTLRIDGSLPRVVAVLKSLHVQSNVRKDLTVDLDAVHALPSTVKDACKTLLSSFENNTSNALYIRYRESQHRRDESNARVLPEALDLELYTTEVAFVSRIRGNSRFLAPSMSLRVRWAQNDGMPWWSLLGLVAEALNRNSTITSAFLDMPKHYWYPQQEVYWVKAAKEVVDAFASLTKIGPRGKVLAAVEKHLWKGHRLFIRIDCLEPTE